MHSEALAQTAKGGQEGGGPGPAWFIGILNVPAPAHPHLGPTAHHRGHIVRQTEDVSPPPEHPKPYNNALCCYPSAMAAARPQNWMPENGFGQWRLCVGTAPGPRQKLPRWRTVAL